MSEKLSWYEEPWMWLVVGLPSIVVVAGLSMLWFATKHPEALVEAPHTKIGFTVKAVPQQSAEKHVRQLSSGGQSLKSGGVKQ